MGRDGGRDGGDEWRKRRCVLEGKSFEIYDEERSSKTAESGKVDKSRARSVQKKSHTHIERKKDD